MAEKHTRQLQTNEASEVKEEEGSYSLVTNGEHSHKLNVKFSPSDRHYHTITCKQRGTVLETLKSSKKYNALNYKDENIVIQLGKGDKEFTVPTHFPCSCIDDDEFLIISCEQGQVEETPSHNEIYSRSEYSVLLIDTVGGQYTKTKKFLRNNNIKTFKYLCVYGEKGSTVEDAVKRDGRFIDDLGEFSLSDNDNPDVLTDHTEYVDNLHKKKFKLCLPRGLLQKIPRKPKQRADSEKVQQKSSNTTDVAQPSRSCGKTDVAQRSSGKTDVAQQSRSCGKTDVAQRSSGSSVETVMKPVSVFSEQVHKKACECFPGLKEWMESKYPNDSYQKTVNLRKENFGKIQNSFSEVKTLRSLIKLGESVCHIKIHSLSSTLRVDGTGFVLFDNIVLTNAHLFKEFVEKHGKNWQQHTEITATFNYEDGVSKSNQYRFNAYIFIYYRCDDLDYAVLRLKDQKHSKQTENRRRREPPPGLLRKCGPLPRSGGACIIGHPAGDVKKMDVTCVIEVDQREQAINSNLEQYKDYIFTLCAINNQIKNHPLANVIVTYNSFMYHGSSGSPVFNAHGQVFGLHSAGFFPGFPKPDESVIEYAHPLLYIFKDFVGVLKYKKHPLLVRVQEVAKGNAHLEHILNMCLGSKRRKYNEKMPGKPKDEAADPDEYLDDSEPMQLG